MEAKRSNSNSAERNNSNSTENSQLLVSEENNPKLSPEQQDVTKEIFSVATTHRIKEGAKDLFHQIRKITSTPFHNLISKCFSRSVLKEEEIPLKNLAKTTLPTVEKVQEQATKSGKNADIQRGFEIPETLDQNHGSFSEKATVLNSPFGIDFLEKSPYEEEVSKQLAFSKKLNEATRTRTSETKKIEEVQGSLCNGWRHSVTENGTEISAIYRSGAFSTHDRPGPGLDQMEKILALPNSKKKTKALKKLCKKWKVESVEELQKAVDVRKELVLAQALEKIGPALAELASNPAPDHNNTLLYVEQSLVSDGNGKEKHMLQDMHWALKHLSKNLTVELSAETTETSISRKDEIITIHLPKPEAKDSNKDPITFNVCSLLFAQGLNGEQSFSHLRKGNKPSYQDQVNLENVKKLHNYAKEKSSTKEREDFLKHFSKESDKSRKGKDVIGMGHIYALTKSAGGAYGTSCKSGKDRTAIWTSRILAGKATEDTDDIGEMQRSLMGGLSHLIAGYNKGAPGYAFGAQSYETTPKSIRPTADLCSGGPT